MRLPLLVASSCSLTAAAALTPVLMHGAPGWCATAVLVAGTGLLIRLRDRHLEADVRHEVRLETLQARPERATKPIPAARRRSPLKIVAEPAMRLDAIMPADVIREGNTVEPPIGAPVEFTTHDWQLGDVVHEGVAEEIMSYGRVKIRCTPDQAYSVPVSSIRLRETRS